MFLTCRWVEGETDGLGRGTMVGAPVGWSDGLELGVSEGASVELAVGCEVETNTHDTEKITMRWG